MRTRISPDNPFQYDRYGFAWAHVPNGGSAHLDVGCYDGAFLHSLRTKNIPQLVGVDISSDAVRLAEQAFPDLKVVHLTTTVPLPFPDETFSSITILDVLEHVHEQAELLKETQRVLAPDGRLIITLPKRHIFSFMDIGNLKFRFPRLHRWYYCRTHSREDYLYRYVCNPHGLVGDISSEKRWHEHFTCRHLQQMLDAAGLAPILLDGSGFFTRVSTAVNYCLRSLTWLQPAVRRFNRLDAKLFTSANLFCVARRR